MTFCIQVWHLPSIRQIKLPVYQKRSGQQDEPSERWQSNHERLFKRFDSRVVMSNQMPKFAGRVDRKYGQLKAKKVENQPIFMFATLKGPTKGRIQGFQVLVEKKFIVQRCRHWKPTIGSKHLPSVKMTASATFGHDEKIKCGKKLKT